MSQDNKMEPPRIVGSQAGIGDLKSVYRPGDAPRGLLAGMPENCFIRKRIIEFADIPAAAPGLEITLGVAADVMIYSDFPMNIGYGETAEYQSVGVLQARYTGVSNKFRFIKYQDIDYGRLVIYYATPSLGANFRRPDPNDCLTQNLTEVQAGGWVGGVNTEPWLPGPGGGVIGQVEAHYLRSVDVWRDGGTVEGIRILENESGGLATLYSKYNTVPGDRFSWYCDKPLRLSCRYYLYLYGSILVGNSDYQVDMCYNVI